ncbi:RecQ family ATP-dependent DNA helicase [Lutimonas zeaxanthinifaciens]|uniref:RecQ family ATP-dependent DNA helicase n=1 Tax=Lutimonas zeaxanthinifaciens TaxID=3060215 RepID=UPI00265D30FF|nr:RecQ family ATP-dependent DNA helicase [Lutimonas sp. YSD2104]WKK67454.1 RecQ family ATP-dependent DNA helicase [Lutimonas sp. YSD2104]
MSKALDLLKETWGFHTFRGQQEAIVNAVADGLNCFVLLPTGGGKSICYQLPALMNEGVCVVISPLIALMQDQVSSLQEKGIKAIALTSKLNRHDTVIAFDNLMHGNYKFLYLSPEKLQAELIQEKIAQLNVNLIAIDEAHCISQWGHDFRPAYLKIPVLNDLFPHATKIALTATATRSVQKDILDNLKLGQCKSFKGSYFRDNLYIKVQKTEDIRNNLLRLLKKNNDPAIVYVGTRKETIEIARHLNANHLNSCSYHGGMNVEEKKNSFAAWKEDRVKIMVATNAFGMGIDKANVRLVIHLYLPNSLENFIQEIGRAGRDNLPSDTVLLYNENSILRSKEMNEASTVTPELTKTIYVKLNDYFQIATGEQPDDIFDFDVQDFAQTYQLPFLKVYYALMHLEQEDVIFYDQQGQRFSRVKVIESSKKLLEIQKENHPKSDLLELLLRSYGGIHDQFININERFLARRLNLNKSAVIKAFRQLDHDKVLIYEESKNNFKLRFLCPREDNFVFQSIRHHIKSRNKVKANKIKAMMRFINNDFVCRQMQLLRYFDEELQKPCGKCDVCLNKKKIGPTNYLEISNDIIALLNSNVSLSLNEIDEELKLDKETLAKTLHILREKGVIALNLQNKFYIKK